MDGASYDYNDSIDTIHDHIRRIVIRNATISNNNVNSNQINNDNKYIVYGSPVVTYVYPTHKQ